MATLHLKTPRKKLTIKKKVEPEIIEEVKEVIPEARPREEQRADFAKLMLEFHVWTDNKPLALDTHKAIRKLIEGRELDISGNNSGSCTYHHVNAIDYLSNIKEGADRFNLDGTKNGSCTKENEVYSLEQIKALQSS